MRPVTKYIFCGFVLAALIFQSFVLFYFVNAYSTAQKNKNKPILDKYGYELSSRFASVSYPIISEFEDIAPITPMGGEEIPGGNDLPGDSLENVEETEPEKEANAVMRSMEIDEEPGQIEDEELETDTPDGSYTEKDLLYSVLLTMKINQQIMIAVIAVTLVILVFKPIVKSYG